MHIPRPLLLIIVALGLVATACSGGTPEALSTTEPAPPGVLNGVAMELHKAVGCGCCEIWEDYFQAQGVVVQASSDPDVQELKVRLGIPEAAWSCHTAIVDGYVIEGHVPAAAVAALLETRPDVIGLAAPGMPAGSPGMGGDESTWDQVDVLVVGTDGSLTPFNY